MKRWSPALAITVLLAVACAPAPPERAPLPDVDEVLDPPAQCSFLVGEPQGVLVQEVIPDSAAEGLLLAGDIIVAFDDAPTPDSEALLSALSEKAAGDMVDVEFLRDDEATSSTVTLGENPDDSGQPRIGVMIRTQYQTVEAADVTDEVAPGPLTRPISIGGTIYLFDPTRTEWERTEVEVGDELTWVGTSSGIYVIEEGAITDLETGETIDHDGLEGWEPIRMIGSVGADLMLVVTQEVPEDPEQVAVGISRFDPATSTTKWVEPVLEGFGIPISALGSPDGALIVVVGVNEGGAEITGVDVWSADGTLLEQEDLVSLGTPVGWMDPDRILFRSGLELATLYTVADGGSEEVTLESAVGGLPLFPVGDGSSVLALDESSLMIEDLTRSGDLRLLAEDCPIGRVGDPGWDA
ncbi:MAG: PDZ domain-containing protein [Acidimicrobiia bacterium]